MTGSDVTRTVTLPRELVAQIEREAHDAFPRECCGLIEGVRDGEMVRVRALHPARNLAERDDRFEIDPEVQFTLLRDLRGTDRTVVGCYHSHPNGRAEPSALDMSEAVEQGFVWLIATTGEGAALAAFAYENGDFRLLEIA